MKLYLIGSLRNPEIPLLGNKIRELGFDVVDDWFGAGKDADTEWMLYEKVRGRHYGEALYGRAARHIFEFDEHHIDTADVGVLMLPAGKSGHLELGYLIGQGKIGFVLFPEEPARFDVMYQFANRVFFQQEHLIEALRKLYSAYRRDERCKVINLLSTWLARLLAVLGMKRSTGAPGQ